MMNLLIPDHILRDYQDVLTPKALKALSLMARFNAEQKHLMEIRTQRRAKRIAERERIGFLDPNSYIPRTNIKVQEARDGNFVGSFIPDDLKRQWIQGTGPAAKPNASLEASLRNVAYALLSGADGWMFDGEDALGQISTMSLDNQRNLKLAIHKDPVFLKVAEGMNRKIADWQTQLDFTTKIFRARGLHLDDRHFRDHLGVMLSASIVDLTLYVVNNYQALQRAGSSLVLYLPKIQTAEEAALWNEMLSTLEEYLSLPLGTIKTYVLVEQLEASFQLMEIRAVLGRHFVGFNTGRWDYINSVADAMAWDPAFINPDIEGIGMTYGYMKNYEDRVRRAVNTPDKNDNFALWQGGMEPNIPVGSALGVQASMAKAVAGAQREQREGASGKWVAHWKMVPIVRPVWEKVGEDNQLGRKFPPLTYTEGDAAGLTTLEPAPRTIQGARNLLSVGLQYGNAFGQGFQAVALKPADYFDNDDILYLMEDMATGEIRLSILWEWLHKGGKLTEDDAETDVHAGDVFSAELFQRLLTEEYDKLREAKDKDVHANSKITTLPIAAATVETYVLDPVKAPWYIDLLNLNLNNHDLSLAQQRIHLYMDTFKRSGTRITKNLDFAPVPEIKQEDEKDAIDAEVAETKAWFASERFREILRLHSARQVVEQRGSIPQDYTVARTAAEAFYQRLRTLFQSREQITTFGPYSPGQAVAMKRAGIEGIYLGGWATSAKGSTHEDPGPDLASYPLSQVPDEAATLVRALLTADKNQQYGRAQMSSKDRQNTRRVNYQPFIIADADTGHGGEAHVRNLIRRFVEAGVPGYHIEDQKPGAKKCGHQGGKVLVPQDEQIKRLNAARFQLDIMKVPGIIVARTDAESATFIDGKGDERDQPYLLGVTNVEIPSYKLATLAVLKLFYDQGFTEVNGHMLYHISLAEYAKAHDWFEQVGLMPDFQALLAECQEAEPNKTVNQAMDKLFQAWQTEALPKTFPQAVADVMRFHIEAGEQFEMTEEAWLDGAQTLSLQEARQQARAMGLHIIWDCELCRTPEGYYQVQCGIDYAIAKSLAVAPFADLLWMETKTADWEDAKRFAEAIHAVYPDKLLAYNLSPSFNWDTTGMSEEEMRNFPKELGKLGYVFNFITYGGHQIDGLAGEEFSNALNEDGMLALARLQRKFRLLDSPYKTPQSLVGSPRLDGALMATSGRTAATKAMGKGSTQFQHLIQTEVPTKLLEEWLALWAKQYGFQEPFRVKLLPHKAGSDLLELSIFDEVGSKIANVIFATIQDRRGSNILSIRDQNNFSPLHRQKRLMSLAHLFLLYRYKIVNVHYLTPTDDNQKQAERLKDLGIYTGVNTEIGQIIVADVNIAQAKEFLNSDQVRLKQFIAKQDALG